MSRTRSHLTIDPLLLSRLHRWWPDARVERNDAAFDTGGMGRYVVVYQDGAPCVGIGLTPELAIADAMTHPDAGCWACGKEVAHQERNPAAYARKECGRCGEH